MSVGSGPSLRYRVYGTELESRRPFTAPLPRARSDRRGAEPELRLRWNGPDPRPEKGGAPGERLWASPIRTPSGKPAVTLRRGPRADWIRYTDVVDFVLHASGRRIDCRVLVAAQETALELYLLGLVLAYWLEREGRLALHGSAVVDDGRAVAFLGNKGSGKSSLAAAFLRQGCPLLTDDLLAVDVSGPRPRAAPGYPQLRMWPDVARHFVGDPDGLPAVVPGGEKRRVSLVEHWDAPFAEGPVPLACIYLPQRAEPGEGGEIRMESVSPGEALFGLVRESFLVEILQAAGLQEARLERLGRLVRAVPVRRLVYPPGFDRLPEVLEAVRADAARRTARAAMGPGSGAAPGRGASSAGGASGARGPR